MTKVIEVLTDSNIGGAGIWVENLLSVIDPSFEMTVVLPEDSLMYKRLNKIKGIRLITLPGIKDQSFSLKGIWHFWRLFGRLKPDVVHSHASLSARIAAKLRPGIYIVNTRHCVEPSSNSRYKSMLKSKMNQGLSHKIHAVSRGVKENLLAEGVPEVQIVAIDNGVRSIKPLPAAECKVVAERYGVINKKVIGYVGRLEPVKGPMDLVKIGLYLKDHMDEPWTMLIAGTGQLAIALQEAIRAENLEDKLKVLGFVEAPSQLYNLMDVCINTSRSEAISLTLLEAMSLRVPVMAYDVDGLDQVVIEGENGYLITPFDTEAYGEKLIKILKNKSLSKDFGDKAYEHMRANFTIEAMAIEIQKLYKERQSYENN